MTTTTTIPGAVRVRPVASADDSFAADEILMRWVGDTRSKLFELAPGGKTFNAVEIAEDESLAVFDVYQCDDWDAMDEKPIARIVVQRETSKAIESPQPAKRASSAAPISGTFEVKRPGGETYSMEIKKPKRKPAARPSDDRG